MSYLSEPLLLRPDYVRPPSANKSRLYIAYYTRSAAKNAGYVKIDAALLLAPKKPKYARAQESWRFQVSRNGQESWEFVGRTTKNRSSNLRAVLLLGKVDGKFTGEEIRNLLADVLVMQDDEMWGRTNWTKDAIQTLIEHEVIAPLERDAGAWEVLQEGYNFAVQVKHDSRSPVPTCNQKGKSIHSEIN